MWHVWDFFDVHVTCHAFWDNMAQVMSAPARLHTCYNANLSGIAGVILAVATVQLKA